MQLMKGFEIKVNILVNIFSGIVTGNYYVSVNAPVSSYCPHPLSLHNLQASACSHS